MIDWVPPAVGMLSVAVCPGRSPLSVRMTVNVLPILVTFTGPLTAVPPAGAKPAKPATVQAGPTTAVGLVPHWSVPCATAWFAPPAGLLAVTVTSPPAVGIPTSVPVMTEGAPGTPTVPPTRLSVPAGAEVAMVNLGVWPTRSPVSVPLPVPVALMVMVPATALPPTASSVAVAPSPPQAAVGDVAHQSLPPASLK